jgi:dipeptidyl aminopeptidase/acylaminoacyl peptidase
VAASWSLDDARLAYYEGPPVLFEEAVYAPFIIAVQDQRTLAVQLAPFSRKEARMSWFPMPPDWAPDGKTIRFMTDYDAGKDWEYYSVGIDGKGGLKAFTDLGVTKDGNRFYRFAKDPNKPDTMTNWGPVIADKTKGTVEVVKINGRSVQEACGWPETMPISGWWAQDARHFSVYCFPSTDLWIFDAVSGKGIVLSNLGYNINPRWLE